MSHTPGPWVVWGVSSNDGEAEVISNADGSKTICWTADTYSEDEDDGLVTNEDLANARLIAAAPEMLIALKMCAERLGEMDCGPEWEAARAAIAKAEGRANETTPD